MRKAHWHSIALLTIAFVTLAAPVSAAGADKKDPIADLQKQINQLRQRVDSLSGRVATVEGQLSPASYSVTCPGGSISAALAAASTAAPVRISIQGTCVEEVVISRDDVTLQGGGTDPTITAPAGAGSAIRIDGVQGVVLRGLVLTGGTFTLSVNKGATFTAYNLKISGAQGSGLYIQNGTSAYLEDSEIAHNQGGGADASFGSSLTLANSQVIDNGRSGLFVQGSVATLWGTNVARNEIGVYVRNGRVGMFPGWPPTDYAILDNSNTGAVLEASHLFMDSGRVAGNGQAITAGWGSVAQLSNAAIEGNGSGVSAYGGSVVKLEGAGVIHGGSGPGISLWDTSTAGGGGTLTVTGSPHGIWCAGPPSVAQLHRPLPGVTTNCPAPSQ